MTVTDVGRIYDAISDLGKEVTGVRIEVAGLTSRVDAAAATATELATVRVSQTDHETADAAIHAGLSGSVRRLWWSYGLGITVSLGVLARAVFA